MQGSWNLRIQASVAIVAKLFMQGEEVAHWKVDSSGMPRPIENVSIEL